MTASTTAPIRLYMSMSLDGFIAGPDDLAGQELGRSGGAVVQLARRPDVAGDQRAGVRRAHGTKAGVRLRDQREPRGNGQTTLTRILAACVCVWTVSPLGHFHVGPVPPLFA
jgi:hypothetical protein